MKEEFIEQTKQILSESEAAEFLKSMEESPSVSVRRNLHKTEDFEEGTDRVKWCENGKYLSERPQFTFDPLLHAGAYYVQDASSMIIQTIVSRLTADGHPVRCLDLCAAPGGKTTSVIDIVPEGSLVVCNEIMNNRAQILRENIIKWGAPNCVVTNNDSKDFVKLGTFFDIILVDAPCSGEGMMRKDQEAVDQWTPKLVEQCVERQQMIIDNALQCLRPGGYLIYSTCTFNRHEDEEMLDYILSQCEGEIVDMEIPEEWGIRKGIDTGHACYRFMPHKTRGEGLFAGVFRKSEDTGEISPSVKIKKKKQAPVQVPKEAKAVIANANKYVFAVNADKIIALPEYCAEDMELIGETLRVIYKGVQAGSIKGRDFVPSQAAAVSEVLNKNAFESVDVDYAQAIAYLRGETIVLENAPKGIVALAYNGVIVGFAKNLGNRANNLYPKEWRIKSAHLPEQPVKVI